MRLSRLAAAGMLALVVCACGGPTSLSPSPQHAATRLPADQGQAMAWLNTYRKDHGLAPVTDDPALKAIAQRQADAMASANLLSHTVIGPLPRRLAALNREKGASAENVSAGYGNLEAALGGWRHSPEHNANLLYAPMRRMG